MVLPNFILFKNWKVKLKITVVKKIGSKKGV